MNVGILIFGDATRSGAFPTEIKFWQDIAQRDTTNHYTVLAVNKILLKKLNGNPLFNFFEKKLIDADNLYPLNDYHCLILPQPQHSNFFGGIINNNQQKSYRIVSYYTNVLNRKVLIRINDSELKVRDYKQMTQHRINAADVKFMTNAHNVPLLPSVIATQQWNYNNVYWLANGNPDLYDWVAETLWDSNDERYRVSTKENFQQNTIYISDDLFFRYNINLEKYAGDVLSNLYSNDFCYIGFFDSVNMSRATILNNLFKENSNVPVHIVGVGTHIIKPYNNLIIEERQIPGDSLPYYDFLNTHLAYIFIAKGKSEAKYIGKTVYDSLVAGTPVVVYKKTDPNNIVFANNDYYFNNETELQEIQNRLLNPQLRKLWVEQQRQEILQRLYTRQLNITQFIRQ
jgi:hypothetical protein